MGLHRRPWLVPLAVALLGTALVACWLPGAVSGLVHALG